MAERRDVQALAEMRLTPEELDEFRTQAEYLLSLDEISPRNANWWFAEARHLARNVRDLLAALDGLVALLGKQEEALRAAEGVLYALPRDCQSARRSEVLLQVRVALAPLSPPPVASGGERA